MSNRALLAIGAVLTVVGSGTAIASGPLSARDAERQICRTFAVELREGAEGSEGFDTADASHPIGAWLHEMSSRGWRLASMQLAVGQKPTGFPQGFQQVCVSPR